MVGDRWGFGPCDAPSPARCFPRIVRTHERTYVLVRAFGKGASAGPRRFPRVRRLFWHRVRRTSYWPTSQVKSVLLVPGPRSLDGRRREIWDASGLRAHLRYLRTYVRTYDSTYARTYVCTRVGPGNRPLPNGFPPRGGATHQTNFPYLSCDDPAHSSQIVCLADLKPHTHVSAFKPRPREAYDRRVG